MLHVRQALMNKSVPSVLADLDPPRIGSPVQIREQIWTPRSISASGFGPPSADLHPLTKLNKNITIHNFLVESDKNSESRFLEKFFRKYVLK